MTLSEQLIAFAKSGIQQRLSTNVGQTFTGWVMEVTDHDLIISIGDGEKGTDVYITFDQLNTHQLFYFDAYNRQWQSFTIST